MYSDAINGYQKVMYDKIQVYNMIIPISMHLLPEDYTEETNSQRTLNNMYAHIDNKVKNRSLEYIGTT